MAGLTRDALLAALGAKQSKIGLLLRLQPKTWREVVAIKGIGRKTARELLRAGLVEDDRPEEFRTPAFGP